VIGSEIATNLDVEYTGKHGVVADVGMTVEGEVRGVERDVSFYQTRNPAIGGTNERPETTPKQPMVNEETVGVLLGRLADRGLTEIDGCGEAADLAGVAHLQPIQRLRRIRDFLGDAEIVIEKAD